MRELARWVFQRPSPGKSPRRLPGPSGITGTKRRRWTTRGCLRTSERRPLSLPGQGRSGHRCPKAHSSGLSRAHIGHRSGDSRAASRPYPASAHPRRQGHHPRHPSQTGSHAPQACPTPTSSCSFSPEAINVTSTPCSAAIHRPASRDMASVMSNISPSTASLSTVPAP